jgi:hypothetical protein
MRAHGITKFPDPNSQGAISLNPSQSGIDPTSPRFQAAMKACEKASGSAQTPAQRAQAVAAAFRFSQCMRAHGVPNFPNPNSQGAFTSGSSSAIDPNAAAFQRAQKTCSPLINGGKPVTVTRGA